MSTMVLHDNLHDLGITRKIMCWQAQAAKRDHALHTAWLHNVLRTYTCREDGCCLSQWSEQGQEDTYLKIWPCDKGHVSLHSTEVSIIAPYQHLLWMAATHCSGFNRWRRVLMILLPMMWVLWTLPLPLNWQQHITSFLAWTHGQAVDACFAAVTPNEKAEGGFGIVDSICSRIYELYMYIGLQT